MTTTRDTLGRRSRTLRLAPLAWAVALLSCSQAVERTAPAEAAPASAVIVKPRAEIDAAWTQAQTIANDMYASNRAAVYDMFHSIRLTTDWWTWSQDPLSFMNGVITSTPDFESRLKIRELRLLDGPVTCGATLQGCTIFPAPLAVAASWDVDQAVAMYAAQGAEKKAKGANVSLSPTMNIIRDPRGGRNFETFSEDPYLSGQLAASAVTGIQSTGVIATAKHYIDNDQETNRSTIIVNVDDRTQHEIYLAPFKAAVDAGAGAFMCSYNKIAASTGNDWACENSYVLKTLLKGELAFRGFVMSDWGATHSGAKAANAGLDVEMNDNRFFLNLDGQITDATAREMARRIVFAHLITNLDDNPATKVTKAQGVETRVVSTAANLQTAQQTAERSLVLLKNAAVSGVPLLPLSKTNRNVAVFGECAETNHVIQGKGSAEGLTNGKTIQTPRQAIANALGVAASTIPYGTEANIDSAVSLAAGKAAAIVVLCATSMEGYGDGGDRAGLNFGAARSFSNANSDSLATRIAATGTPTVVVVVSPGQMTMPWAGSVRAILWGGLLGEMQAQAIARVLFGDVNPSGKLPITFGTSLSDYPTASSFYGTISDLFPGNGTNVYYREGLNVGYRHFDARNITPMFPFGHGLSYTTFGYANLSVTPSVNATANESVTVSLDLSNTGAVAGAEVVQVYLGFPAAAGEPPKVLKGFQKVSLAAGQTQRVSVTLAPESYRYWSSGWVPALGTFQVLVGSSSRDIRLTGSFQVTDGTSDTFRLCVSKTGMGAGTVVSSPAGISCGSTCCADFPRGTTVTFTATASSGSMFAGWSGACSGATCSVTANAALTIGATFNPIQTNNTITVTKTGAGTGTVTGPGIDCGTTCSGLIANDVVITLTATASAGSRFGGWSGSCSGTGTCVLMGGADRAVTASFVLDLPMVTLTVTKSGTGTGTVTSSPAGISCGATCSANFAGSSVVTLSAAAASGSTFTGWSGACVLSSGNCVVTLSAAQTVNATFTLAPGPTLTVMKTGNGTGTVSAAGGAIDCGATCSASFPSGTIVTLTATAAAPSAFVGWSGACTGTSRTCTLSMTTARSVGAAFAGSSTSTLLSQGKPATASSTASASYPASYAVDASGTTRWASVASDPQWIQVDLGQRATIDLVVLRWASAYGRSYQIQVSDDGAAWTTVFQTTTGTSGLQALAVSGAGRYVRMYGTVRSSSSGYSLYDFQVWGAFGQTTTQQLIVGLLGQGLGRVVSTPAGIDCGPTCVASFPTGTVLTLTATPDTASSSFFAGWSGACTATVGACVVTMSQAQSVSATFYIGQTTQPLTVTKRGDGTGTVVSTPAGIDCGATCTASFTTGAVVTLTATPGTGSAFGGWSGACTGAAATCTVSMTLASTVTAAFNPIMIDPLLTVARAGTGSGTVTSSPGGISCGSTCSAMYSPGTVVSLTAAAASGSMFSGWSGGCTGTATVCTLTVNGPVSVTATFGLPPSFSVTVAKTGTGTGTVTSSTGGINCGTTCSATYASGAVVTLTAAPATLSTFAGWSGACSGTATTCVLTVTATVTATAMFNTGEPAPCANPVTFASNTGNFNTTGAVCYRTAQRVNGWGCANFEGRTISVNGGTATAACGAGPFPLAQVGGYTYFSATGGSFPWASIYIW